VVSADRVESLPIEPALGADGRQIVVKIDTRTNPLHAKVWKMAVGRVSLYLLDSDVEGNTPEDRELTSRLYGGDNRTRIRQELILGVGGVRAIRALGIVPGVYHLNEGHSAFATLEAVRGRMDRDGYAFDDAVRKIARQTVFTTHTPVPAGHDRFDSGLIEEHLGPMRDALGISHDHLMSLGRVETHNPGEPFCMTVLGLKLSRRANAVSALHGHVSRRMWQPLWPSRVEEEVPIGHITNGVHVPTWLSWQMLQLYDRIFPAHWFRRMGEPDIWQKIHECDPGELWETHYALKNLLLQFVRRRLARQCRRRGECDEAVEMARYSAAVTPRTVPGVPTGLAGAAGQGSVTLRWAAPASNGGAVIIDHRVQYSSNNGVTWTTFTGATTAARTVTVTGLTNGTSYVFRVAALNVAGAGGYTVKSAAVTPRTWPGAPTNLTATPVTGKVNLAWRAPASNGGAAISDYIVQYSNNDGATWRVFKESVSSATSASVTGLTRGTSYVFRVVGMNAAGSGEYSEKSSAIVAR